MYAQLRGDGRRDAQAADYAAETLHKNLLVELQLLQGEETGAAEKALDAAFSATDSGMKLSVPQSCGTTAVVALVTRPKVGSAGEGGAPSSTDGTGGMGARTLHVANAGDARAVLCKDITGESFEAERLSIDHKPGNPEERKRIEQVGAASASRPLRHTIKTRRFLRKALVSAGTLLGVPGTAWCSTGCRSRNSHTLLLLHCLSSAVRQRRRTGTDGLRELWADAGWGRGDQPAGAGRAGGVARSG
jgi:hypothetical protein